MRVLCQICAMLYGNLSVEPQISSLAYAVCMRTVKLKSSRWHKGRLQWTACICEPTYVARELWCTLEMPMMQKYPYLYQEESVTSRNMHTPAIVHFNAGAFVFRETAEISCRNLASVAYIGHMYVSFVSPWAFSVGIALTSITYTRSTDSSLCKVYDRVNIIV